MIRIVILTSCRFGIASSVLRELNANQNLRVVKVFLANGGSPNKTSMLMRKIKKIARIGLLGALNGIRLRRWYVDHDAEDIRILCQQMNVPLFEINYINCQSTQDHFAETNSDLGLSLGNGYIGKRIFSIPKFGMINIHNEILPRFQGAQSIIWPIYEMINETGFTIHQINSGIDTGDILFIKKYPIEFYPTLRETVKNNFRMANMQIPSAFSYVCENYNSLKSNAIAQVKGIPYMTPTYCQFLRMIKHHRILYRQNISRTIR